MINRVAKIHNFINKEQQKKKHIIMITIKDSQELASFVSENLPKNNRRSLHQLDGLKNM